MHGFSPCSAQERLRLHHIGDFGAWPDPARIDGATKRHDGAGDFPRGSRSAARRRAATSAGGSSAKAALSRRGT